MPAVVNVHYSEHVEQPGAEPKPAGTQPPQVLVRQTGSGKPREDLLNPGQAVVVELGGKPGQVTVGLADQGSVPAEPEPPPEPEQLPEPPPEPEQLEDEDEDDDKPGKGKAKPRGRR